MTEEQKKIEEVLGTIQRAANLKFGEKLFKTIYPDKKLMKGFDVLIKSDLPEWKKKFYGSVRKDFDKTEVVIDEEVLKQQEKFIQKQINKAVKDGLLPKEYDQEKNNPISASCPTG